MKLFLCIFAIASFVVSCFPAVTDDGVDHSGYYNGSDSSGYGSSSNQQVLVSFFDQKLIKKINDVTTLLKDPSVAKEVDTKVKETILFIINKIKKEWVESKKFKKFSERHPLDTYVWYVKRSKRRLYDILSFIDEKAENLGSKGVLDAWEKWEECKYIANIDRESDCYKYRLNNYDYYRIDFLVRSQSVVNTLKKEKISSDNTQEDKTHAQELLDAIYTIRAEDSILNQLKKILNPNITRMTINEDVDEDELVKFPTMANVFKNEY